MPAYLLSQSPSRDFAQGETVAKYLDGVDQVLVYSLPLVTRFRRINVREGLLLHGRFGWAECAPFWDYAPVESAIWLKSALEVANFGVFGVNRLEGSVQLSFVRDFVPVNATIPVESPEENAARAESLSCATAKVKVADPGISITQDAERVCAVAEVLAKRFGARARVRVDANAAWTLEQAQAGIELLQEAAKGVGGLEYVEQPCDSVSEMAKLRQMLAGEVLVAADESIRRATDPLHVVRAGGADLAVVKVAPLGGPKRLLKLAKQLGQVQVKTQIPAQTNAANAADNVASKSISAAKTGEFPLVVSSALDSSIGLAAATLVAANLPVLPYACGLNTGRLLAEDVIDEPLVSQPDTPGMLSAQRALEILTGPVKIAGRAPADLAGKWCERLRAMLACLEAECMR